MNKVFSKFSTRTRSAPALQILAVLVSGLFLTTLQSRPLFAGPTTAIEDKSLSNEKYVALGLPAYDRDWTGRDMAAAETALKALAQAHPNQLPRYHSKISGKMFDRITSKDNLAYYRKPSLLTLRLTDGLQFIHASSNILKLYLAAFLAKHVGGDEIVELMASQLRNTQMMLTLTDEFVPTIPRNDPNYSIRMQGLEKMRHGLAMIAAGTITTLEDSDNLDTKARFRLLSVCRETFPAIVTHLTTPSQTELVQRLTSLAHDPTNTELHAQLVLLRDEVRTAMNTEK